MTYIIKAPQKLQAEIQLPASKSISNRVLILNALSQSPYAIENLSDCDDTKVMLSAFLNKGDEAVIDICAAGTAMRFLTAYFSQLEGIRIITGTERMKNRPIAVLVEALRKIGAQIEYMEKDGFPPLKITGKKLRGGIIDLEGNISSQYISALMMIAPCMSDGLTINLLGDVISKPYIGMTRRMMEDFGVRLQIQENRIVISTQLYKPVRFLVENDWSAASYWYEILALSNDPDARILLPGLYPDSMQGDSAVADLFSQLGVVTCFTENGVVLKKTEAVPKEFLCDFVDQPDLAQTFAVTCCLKNIPFRFSGLQSLKIKETDRIFALKTELAKLGYRLSERENSILEWNGEMQNMVQDVAIDTYEDHRMAMAFAPATVAGSRIRINHPEVVSKSYPDFWEDLKRVGFDIISTQDFAPDSY